MWSQISSQGYVTIVRIKYPIKHPLRPIWPVGHVLNPFVDGWKPIPGSQTPSLTHRHRKTLYLLGFIIWDVYMAASCPNH